tara:strand:- start:835 stop:1440 length:606 start_codon:yes stop_codon:yes gene_type:complete
MPVNVNIIKPDGQQQTIDGSVGVDVKPTIGIKITNNNLKDYVFELTARETLSGDLMIYDHKDIDIVLMQEKKKIVAFAKDMLTDTVYGAESRMFEHLRQHGIVAYDSIQGGNIYGSMEAKILESKKFDSIKSALVEIANWFKEETPMMESLEDHDQIMDDALLDPDDEHATELGEVPHEEEKGSILQNNMFSSYMYGRYTY